MSQPALLLLGSPRLERDGEPVEVDTRKAIALVTYLAVTQGRHTRDTLATLLWPEYDQSRARAALRRTLSALSEARAEGWLDVDRESVGLNRDELWVDVDRFHSRLAECKTHGHPEADVCPDCLPLLAEAATLYRDDFLAGFTLRDSPNFDEWQFFQAESLRRELAGALERLVRAHGARGEWEPAIAYARRWLTLDPLDEPAHRALMQLYAWADQRAAGLRQYRECVRVLERELGVQPLEETTRLYQSVKENRVLPPSPSALRSPLSPFQTEEKPASPVREASSGAWLSESPLVGRSEERATLIRAYEAAVAGGHIVALEGEAGIGKTRLAEELLAHAQNRGAVTVVARCYAGEANLAYGPFVEGFSTAIGQDRADRLEELPEHTLSEAARLLPQLANLRPKLSPPPPLNTPGAQRRFFESIGQVLLAICRSKQPGVLFFDDLHWADDASLDLLAYLARRLHGRPLYVLLTWRTEQVPARHRLRELLAEAQRAGTATTLTLPRLSRPAVKELVRSVVSEGADLPDELDERLYYETEGLPLFLKEYLAAVARGTLTDVDANWSLPEGVRDLLRGRLQTTSETSWQLLTSAAVIGRSFDFDTAREASGRSEEETITALEELVSRGLVREIGGDTGERTPTYDFTHEKLRALVYEETSLARRRLLHRRVAETLVIRARGDQKIGLLAGQIAHHHRLAGQEREAANYFKLAGEHAYALYANRDALGHLGTALALGHPDAAALHEAIGDLHTLLGEYAAALASYEAAAALCEVEAIAVVERKLGNVYQRRGEWELAESHFEAALGTLGESGMVIRERAGIYADWSLSAHRRDQTSRAVNLARRALELAERADDAYALAQAHNILGILTSSQGDIPGARHHLERSLALAETLGDNGIKTAALNNLALAYGASGEIEQAIERTRTALTLCASQGDRHCEAALRNNLADLLHAAGRSEEAMSHLKQAVVIYADIGVEGGAVRPEIWKLAEW